MCTLRSDYQMVYDTISLTASMFSGEGGGNSIEGIYLDIYINVCIYICIYTYVYVYMYMYVYMICIYICIYIFIA
jgi:hypothetical protein